MRLSQGLNYPLGLDISDLSLKFVQLDEIKNNISLKNFGRIDLPNSLIEGGVINDEKAVISAMTELLKNKNLSGSGKIEVTACLPETKTFVKLIEVENSLNDLADMVRAETEKYIPISLKDMYLDWQTIKNLPDKKLILVGAAPRNIVDQYVRVLKGANFSISSLEIESTAICRGLLETESPWYGGAYDSNYCLIDFGAKRSSLIIYSKNTIALSVSLPISGEAVTADIAKTLELDKPQAEKAKVVCGLDKSKAKGIISDILAKKIDELILRIKEALSFFNENYSERGKVDEIILCGGGANIKKLDTIISDAVAVKTTIGNAFTNLKIPDEKTGDKSPTISQNASLTYVTAIGLALRSIFLEKIN
ncbi:MAG: type IV pilus assembly protein PilM [Candidatus Falkowbacteria bacterium]